MSNDSQLQQWEQLLEDIDKSKIPIEFIKKLVVKLGRRQKTINIERLFNDGLDPESVEMAVGRQLEELESEITNIDFILNVEKIALTVQPETDDLLRILS
jgi:hypothetical protein